LSRGSSPCGYQHEPLVSYQINRQLSGWILPPLMIRAFGAHCQEATYARQQTAPLFDHLVGAAYEGQWNGETERLRGLEIDDQLDFGGLLHRQVGGLLTLENAAGIYASLTIHIQRAP
jgi:hypothetical protein